jgi:hypothetical protein
MSRILILKQQIEAKQSTYLQLGKQLEALKKEYEDLCQASYLSQVEAWKAAGKIKKIGRNLMTKPTPSNITCAKLAQDYENSFKQSFMKMNKNDQLITLRSLGVTLTLEPEV